MPEFEEQIDDDNATCPYCKESYQVEAEDYSEDERIEQCGGCGKKYELRQVFSVDHRTKPDCAINDKDHDWYICDSHRNLVLCGICETYRQLTDEDDLEVRDIFGEAVLIGNV